MVCNPGKRSVYKGLEAKNKQHYEKEKEKLDQVGCFGKNRSIKDVYFINQERNVQDKNKVKSQGIEFKRIKLLTFQLLKYLRTECRLYNPYYPGK